MAAQNNYGNASRWDLDNEKFSSGKLFSVDTSGNLITTPDVVNLPSDVMQYNTDINNPNARIGDYVYINGKPELVPNSMTDLANRYQVIYGGTEKPEANIGFSNVGGGAVSGAAIGGTLGSVAGSFLPGPGNIIGGIAGALIGGVAGGLKSYNDATEEALKNWNNEKIKYDTAVDFYRDDNGELKYKLDYQKVAAAGPRSEQWAKDMQNKETSVALGDDGRLKVAVSPIFASTERFKEIMDWISENYAGLSRNTENYETILKQIQDGIDGEVKSYNTNIQLYADYATRFPEASPDSIVPAYMTEIAGYVDPEKMSDYSMAIVGDDGIEVKSAQDFFNSVYDMSKDDRNRLVSHLNDVIYGGDGYHTDDEKAVALGEMRALYAVSNNSEGYKDDKYQGMMDADWFVSFINHFAPLGIQTGDVLNFISGGNIMATKQEFLNQDDMASFIGIVGGTAAGLGLFRGGTTLIEKGLKLLPGSSNLFNASIEGYQGGTLAFVQAYLEGSSSSNLVAMVKNLWNSGNIGAVGKAFAASAAFKTLKLGVFDAALAGTKTLVSGTDFWPEFGQDLARDAILETIFSYYDMVQYTKSVYGSTKQVYRNKETGEWIAREDANAERVFLATDGAPDEYVFTSIGLDGKPEEFVKSGGTGVFEPSGKFATQQTRAGTKVGVYQSDAVVALRVDDMVVVATPTGETQKYITSGDGVVDGIPLLDSGISKELSTTTASIAEAGKALEQAGFPEGLSSSYEPVTLPTQNLEASIVAGKIAKFDTSKVGLAVNKWLLNKNASLEALNEMVLAKDADLTGWQNRTELIVSVNDNANQEIARITNGFYSPSTIKAFEDYDMALGELKLSKTLSKAGKDYLKAIRAMEVAAYFDRTKTVDDTRNYVAEALEKYGDAIAKIPQDKAEALNKFQDLRKARNKAIEVAAKKSGKIDMKALDNVMESDIQSELGWVPQWRKKETYNGLLSKFYGVSQKREIFKTWDPNNGWVDLDKLEDPIRVDERFLGFVGFNMGVNDFVETTVDMLDKNGMLFDNTPSPATVRRQKLDSIKNKDELKKKFTELIKAKQKEIHEKVPTQKQYVDMMTDLYEKHQIDDAINGVVKPTLPDGDTWDSFWKGATPEVRKAIREELAKTSQTTGYGILDTRARLNSMVPGFDVLDWSLLGREHTNGLVPGGLYANMERNETKAYIVTVEELKKLLGLSGEAPAYIFPTMAEKFWPHINTINGNAPIPLKISKRGSSNNGENIVFDPRGGSSMGNRVPDARHLHAYLDALENQGIKEIPIVIWGKKSDSFYDSSLLGVVNSIDKAIATGKKPKFKIGDIAGALKYPGMSEARLRRRIRGSIPALGSEAVSYITEDELDKLFEKAKKYDLEKSPEYEGYSSIESNIEEKIGRVPKDITTDIQRAFSEYSQIPFYRGQSGMGDFYSNGSSMYPKLIEDAYWIAPNASYTDNYGKDKIAGNIPVKYFMSDKEKDEIANSLSKKQAKLEEKMHKAFVEAAKKSDDIDALMRIFPELTSGELASVRARRELIANDQLKTDLAKEYDKAIDFMEKALSKRELQDYDEITKVVNSSHYFEASSGRTRDKIKSYRALAEYAKKPVIDISEDGFANGTAFFYYKGISPEFDKEVGEQLATQALLDAQHPQWSGDAIAEAMEEFDGMSLDELIDNVTMGEGFGDDWYNLFELFEDGEISSGELSNEVSKYFENVEKKYPGVGEVMQEIWDNNAIQDTRDMKLKYWDSSTGYPTIEDRVAGAFLDFMGALRPSSGEAVAENQASLYDVIRPTVSNIPNQPEFKQPRRVTYEDYQRGVDADPSAKERFKKTIKLSSAKELVRRSSSLMYDASEYNKHFGYVFDVKAYLNTALVPNLRSAMNQKDKALLASIVNKGMMDVAPYQSRAQLLKSAQESVAEEWRAWAESHIKGAKTSTEELKQFVKDNNLELPTDNRPYPNKIKHALWEKVEKGEKLPEIEGLGSYKDMDKEAFYKALDATPLFQGATKNKRELVDLVAAEINGETLDAYEMGAATEALGMGGRYPFSFFRKGRPYTRFGIYHDETEKRLLEDIYEIVTDKQLIKQPGIVSRFMSGAANGFRLLKTGLDPTRALTNLSRDTSRSPITSAGQTFIFANDTLKSTIDLGDYTKAEKEKLKKALDNTFDQVSGETYNAAYRSGRKIEDQAALNYLSKTGASPLRVFVYKATHDPLAILEKPQDFFEGFTRKRLAKSAAAVKLGQLQREGASFKEQLKGAVDAAFFAGREYTANFKRKGKLIEQTSKYVAYQSSAYAGLESMKIAFINNPKGVARNFGMFILLYLILLADTLGNEKTRKNYYRLSDYDRGNNVVISLDEETIMTLPLDQEVAAFIFPYRRILETLNGTDPVSFYEFVWGTLTEPLPMDLSGFTEGEGFNLARGLQKLTSQNMPNIISGVQEASTGYDLYYGSDLSVSDETLKGYGIYNPEPGDYTTSGKDSATLRRVANTTGIPQWQLQTMVDNYGGNIGAYVLNIIDKLSGATEEQQGGKSFADSVFKSFVATDQDAASSVFYSGIKQLQTEKHKLVQKIANYNEDLKVASGDTKIALQAKLQKAKDDYAVKVGDFVDKYISAYEITGGLSKSQAMQVYYLFRLDDDDTVYRSGSVEEYYSNKALQQFKNEASAMSAPILDKYYNNRIGNIYQDSDGVWRRYLSSGAQAMRNSVYGESEEHMVSLLNLLEGKGSNMKNLRSQVREARSAAYDAKDYDLADKIGYEFDLKVMDAIAPYIEQYGAENVLGTNEVLDYLSDWFIVPDSFKKTKRGGYVSLGNNASSQEAFVRPYIKYLFGLPTNYSSYSNTSLNSPALGELGR